MGTLFGNSTSRERKAGNFGYLEVNHNDRGSDHCSLWWAQWQGGD